MTILAIHPSECTCEECWGIDTDDSTAIPVTAPEVPRTDAGDLIINFLAAATAAGVLSLHDGMLLVDYAGKWFLREALKEAKGEPT